MRQDAKNVCLADNFVFLLQQGRFITSIDVCISGIR